MTNHDGGENKTATMLREYRRLVEDKLEILMPPAGEPPASLHEAMRYSVLGGGKRFRAMLCLSAHRLFGDPFPDAALQAACSVEMLHAYTLIHDDLPAIDDDDMRRGRRRATRVTAKPSPYWRATRFRRFRSRRFPHAGGLSLPPASKR